MTSIEREAYEVALITDFMKDMAEFENGDEEPKEEKVDMGGIDNDPTPEEASRW